MIEIKQSSFVVQFQSHPTHVARFDTIGIAMDGRVDHHHSGRTKTMEWMSNAKKVGTQEVGAP